MVGGGGAHLKISRSKGGVIPKFGYAALNSTAPPLPIKNERSLRTLTAMLQLHLKLLQHCSIGFTVITPKMSQWSTCGCTIALYAHVKVPVGAKKQREAEQEQGQKSTKRKRTTTTTTITITITIKGKTTNKKEV